MENIRKINQRIKELECDRYKTIKEFVELSNLDKINYDLDNTTVVPELEKRLKQINELGFRLHELYDVKNQLEKLN